MKKTAKKASLKFAPLGAKKIESVFSGGMYVEKNTARPSNVRPVRLRRAGRALRQAAKNSKKWLRHLFRKSY
jgi:hypothetical protein